jgi:hypothetical protein
VQLLGEGLQVGLLRHEGRSTRADDNLKLPLPGRAADEVSPGNHPGVAAWPAAADAGACRRLSPSGGRRTRRGARLLAARRSGRVAARPAGATSRSLGGPGARRRRVRGRRTGRSAPGRGA